jgi:uncharacterized protein YbjT (DUF2867 family)
MRFRPSAGRIRLVVFIAGANGFIGQRLAGALEAAGYEVVAGVRDVPNAGTRRAIAIDFVRDHDPAAWQARLAGVDVVVNAVGILRERGAQTFAALHRDAPRALFAAAAQAGVKLVVQISALGADEDARSAYHLSKKAADDFLATLPITHAIVQPSLVFGVGGASARLFAMLASMPWIPVPGRGDAKVQPVHVDDLCACVVALAGGARADVRIPVVGPRAMSLREFLAALRRALGLARPRFLSVPMPLVRAAASIGERLPGALLDRETLGMLERGNVADASATRRLLGCEPRAVEAFVARDVAPLVRSRAKLDWLLPVLRVAIATLWIVTGIVSLGVFPVAESHALLARAGVPAALAPFALYGAALLDIALGVATLALARRRWLWRAQAMLILGYTAIISWRLPEFWLHPYGPILKNVPLLAALWLLDELEET